MKRLYYTILLVAATTFTSCMREDSIVPSQESDVLEVYATTEDMAPTKTFMEGTEVLWSVGDQIVAFLGNTLPKRFALTDNSAGSKDAMFQHDKGYVIIGNNESISNNLAYYPFNEDVICEPEGTLYRLRGLTLPSVQTYALNSAGNGTYPMVAVTKDVDDVNYHFRNVCGALMFQLQGSGSIKSVSVKGNSDEVLCGSAIVTAAYGKVPEIALLSDGGKSVTLDCGEAGVRLASDSPTAFIISLPPVSFTNGFTIVVTDSMGGTEEYTTSKKNSILRSTILRMPVKEYDGATRPSSGDYIDEYGINHGQGVEIAGVVWAPVNCGYHETDFKYGKLYQWGRKYGQGYDGDLYDSKNTAIGQYADAVVPKIQYGPVDLAVGQSKKNEDKFYVVRTAYDWHNSDNNSVLWNAGTESAPKKTEYDPCPQGWRVPTFNELCQLSSHYSASMVNNEGQLGRWMSGSLKYGENVPAIFLSAAGRRNSETGKASGRGYEGIFWASKSGQYIISGTPCGNGGTISCPGASVRCVKDNAEFITVQSVIISTSSLSMKVGATAVLSATVIPTDATDKTLYWISDDESVATIDADGRVTAVSVGTTSITVTSGNHTDVCVVEVSPAQDGDYIDEYGINHGQGVEIDGVVWAPVNCGYHAEHFIYGKLYQWGRKYGQGYSGTLSDGSRYYDDMLPTIMEGPVDLSTGQSPSNAGFFYTSTSDYHNDWLYPSDDTLWNSGTDVNPKRTDYDPCPQGWRVPLSEELNELHEHCSSWMTNNEAGQKGYWFSGSNIYTSSVPQVFFPAAGYRSYYAGSAGDRGEEGKYWSSSPYNYVSKHLHLSSNQVIVQTSIRAQGYSVRCVME